jgi:hypothetical protein
MRRERIYRLWTTGVAIAACVSGAVLWWHGERLIGGLGLATSLLHARWASEARAWVRRHRPRRPIVIARLRRRDDTMAAPRAAATHDAATHDAVTHG